MGRRSMRCGILGPLEVTGDDGPVLVAGAKQRALLVLLLVNADRVVSVDRLIDQLWAGQPPAPATGPPAPRATPCSAGRAPGGAAPPSPTWPSSRSPRARSPGSPSSAWPAPRTG